MAAPPSSAGCEFKGMSETRGYRGEHAHRLVGDLAADAIAGENCDQRLQSRAS